MARRDAARWVRFVVAHLWNQCAASTGTVRKILRIQSLAASSPYPAAWTVGFVLPDAAEVEDWMGHGFQRAADGSAVGFVSS